MKDIWDKHSLSIILGILSLAFLIASIVFGYLHWSVEGSAAHGPFVVWWFAHGFMEFLGEAFVGGFLFIWLTKEFREDGSPESGDN